MLTDVYYLDWLPTDDYKIVKERLYAFLTFLDSEGVDIFGYWSSRDVKKIDDLYLREVYNREMGRHHPVLFNDFTRLCSEDNVLAGWNLDHLLQACQEKGFNTIPFIKNKPQLSIF